MAHHPSGGQLSPDGVWLLNSPSSAGTASVAEESRLPPAVEAAVGLLPPDGVYRETTRSSEVRANVRAELKHEVRAEAKS